MSKLPFSEYKVRISSEYDKASLAELIKEENLNPEETCLYIGRAVKVGYMVFLCMDFPRILPPISYFVPARDEAKKRVWQKLVKIMTPQEAL